MMMFVRSYLEGQCTCDTVALGIVVDGIVVACGILITTTYFFLLCEWCRNSDIINCIILLFVYLSAVSIWLFEGYQISINGICFFGSEHKEDHSLKEKVHFLTAIGQLVIIFGRLTTFGWLSKQGTTSMWSQCTKVVMSRTLQAYILFIFSNVLNRCIHYFFGCYIHLLTLMLYIMAHLFDQSLSIWFCCIFLYTFFYIL